MKPDIYRIYPALVIKNTPMDSMYKSGIYKPYTLEETIHITKILYCMLVSNGINVIRVGLQPTKEINTGAEIVCGPFHPAFRELVIGSIYNELLESNIPEGYKDVVKIEINPKDISKLYANGKKFFKNMKLKLNIDKIQVIQKNYVKRDSFILILGENKKKLSIEEVEYR